jgi:hypothetical protein
MFKKPSFIFLFLSFIIVLVLFRVKYAVGALEILQNRLKKEIVQNKEAIHVLKAEWHHLNDPKRLQTLCGKYLSSLKPVSNTQLIMMRDIVIASNSPSGEKELDDFIASLSEDSQKTRLDQ